MLGQSHQIHKLRPEESDDLIVDIDFTVDHGSLSRKAARGILDAFLIEIDRSWLLIAWAAEHAISSLAFLYSLRSYR